MDPQGSQVGYDSELPCQFTETRIRQGQGITPAQDDLADFLVTFKIGQRSVPVRGRRVGIAIREMPAETVAAVHGAGTCQGE